MQEIFEEYGEFVIEAVGGVLLLGIATYYFLGPPMSIVIQRFITSVFGGGL